MDLARGRAVVEPFKRAFRDDATGKLSWWLALILIAISVVGGMLRIGPRMALDSLWAEDGNIFLSATIDQGLGKSLLQPYAGYAHVVPRLLSALAALGPLWAAAAIINLETAAVCGLLAVLVFRATSGHIASPYLRFALALFVGLQPIAGEVLASLANLQWYFLFSAFVVLLWSAKSPSALMVGALVCFFAATSSPFGVLLIPFAALRILLLRDLRAAIAPVALLIGVSIQAAVMLSAPTRELHPLASPIRLGGWYLGRVIAPTFFGERLAGTQISATALLLGLFAVALMVCLWFTTSRAGRREMWPSLLLIAVFSVLAYLAPAVTAGLAAPRYAVPPGFAVAFTVTILLGRALTDPVRTRSPGRARGIEIAPVVATTAVILLGWMIALPAARAPGPLWSESLNNATDACSREPIQQTQLPISPAGWTATLPCAEIRASR